MRILVFGDSIAVGAFDTEHNGWVSLLAMYQYKRILDTKWKEGDSVVNVSVSGNASTELLQRVVFEADNRQWEDEPFVSILAIGTNDAAVLRGEQQVAFSTFSSNVQKIIDILSVKSEQVVVLGLAPVYEKLSSPWCFDEVVSWKNKPLEKYDAELQRIAAERALLFISLQDVLDKDSNKHLPDGIHPNAEGHRLIFERVKSELEKAGVL